MSWTEIVIELPRAQVRNVVATLTRGTLTAPVRWLTWVIVMRSG